MTVQKILCFFFAGFLFAACNKGNPLLLPEISTDLLKSDSTILNSDLILIGPGIDSVNAEVAAGCDCCASKLVFLNDSSFIYKVLCLGGDSYVKGNYVFFGDLLVLHLDEEVISSEYEHISENTPVHYEVTSQKRDFHVYRVSYLKGKPLITYVSKDGYKEYGMPVTGSMNDFLSEFRKEKVLRRFLEKE